MPVCVAAGGLVTVLAMQSFTLAWTHSIEKIRWEEDYRVSGAMLVLVEGADPRQRRRHGAARGQHLGRRRPGTTTRTCRRCPRCTSPTRSTRAGYELCHDNRCTPLADAAPRAGNGNVIEVSACPR